MTPAERKAYRVAYRERENRHIEALKASLAQEHGLERNRKFDIAWDIAWDRGHHAGFSEVKMCFEEMVELLKP